MKPDTLRRPAVVLALIFQLQHQAPEQPELGGVRAWRVGSTLPDALGGGFPPWFLSWRGSDLKIGSAEQGWVWEGSAPPGETRSLALVRMLLKRARNLQEAVKWASEMS